MSGRPVPKQTLVSLFLIAAGASITVAQLPSSRSSDESAIRAIEKAWDTANLKGDPAALEGLLADEFILTGEDGRVHAKAEVVAALHSGKIRYHSAATEELRIILHGDAAVASGRWRGKYTNRGREVSLLERFTNFYVRRRGQWQCVASHGSAIR